MPEPIRVERKSNSRTRAKIREKIRRTEIDDLAGRSDERLRQAARTVAERTNTDAPEGGRDALVTYLVAHYATAREVLG